MNKAVEMGGSLVSAPLHEQVKDRIVERITSGSWSAGDVLPTETELAKMLGVSYGTIRRAMGDLTNEGIVMRRRRTGTVVTGRMPNHTLSRFYKYFRLQTSDGQLITTVAKVLGIANRQASQAESERLKLPPDTCVTQLTRVRIAGDKPVMLDNFIIPHTRVSNFPTTTEAVPELIFNWLLAEHGIQLGAVLEKVTARIATQSERKMLEVESSDALALLDINALALDNMNEPLLIMQHAALTEAHCYVNEMR
ncbi:GntR family transcriptional regulator [Granulosicoccus antarcticus]|uniref:Putative HTH-type transcriptional regulator YurK n=1 Tax=Granulosicoccus antarcticus IMCC3135 TaxID=1192854 RepID=A0A2Z2NZ57_9GAMM|nr:GntR family transcriptional regulator [Granulosicoccus antarcticus]ASJ73067.1 putative HTH-type transcriptional regulator YurK [Granulosicoccus antarcticus IMCC3135]